MSHHAHTCEVSDEDGTMKQTGGELIRCVVDEMAMEPRSNKYYLILLLSDDQIRGSAPQPVAKRARPRRKAAAPKLEQCRSCAVKPRLLC